MAATKSLKSYFLRGLAVLLPTIVTIWILVWGYKFIQSSIGVHINRLLAWLTIFIQGGPDKVDAQWWRNFWIHGWGSLAGFVIALVVVLAMGVSSRQCCRQVVVAGCRTIHNEPTCFESDFPAHKTGDRFFVLAGKNGKAVFEGCSG